MVYYSENILDTSSVVVDMVNYDSDEDLPNVIRESAEIEERLAEKRSPGKKSVEELFEMVKNGQSYSDKHITIGAVSENYMDIYLFYYPEDKYKNPHKDVMHKVCDNYLVTADESKQTVAIAKEKRRHRQVCSRYYTVRKDLPAGFQVSE